MKVTADVLIQRVSDTLCEASPEYIAEQATKILGRRVIAAGTGKHHDDVFEIVDTCDDCEHAWSIHVEKPEPGCTHPGCRCKYKPPTQADRVSHEQHEAWKAEDEKFIAEETGSEQCDTCSPYLPGIIFPIAANGNEEHPWVECCGTCKLFESDVKAAIFLGRKFNLPVKMGYHTPEYSARPYIDMTWNEAFAFEEALRLGRLTLTFFTGPQDEDESKPQPLTADEESKMRRDWSGGCYKAIERLFATLDAVRAGQPFKLLADDVLLLRGHLRMDRTKFRDAGNEVMTALLDRVLEVLGDR